MNDELANALNSHMNPDTGLLDMRAVITTLEAFYRVDTLDALYTGGNVAHDELRAAYEQAAAWNRDVRASMQQAEDKPGSWRGVKVFIVGLLATLAPLLAIAAVGL
jgi:hypothetical protein